MIDPQIFYYYSFMAATAAACLAGAYGGVRLICGRFTLSLYSRGLMICGTAAAVGSLLAVQIISAGQPFWQKWDALVQLMIGLSVGLVIAGLGLVIFIYTLARAKFKKPPDPET